MPAKGSNEEIQFIKNMNTSSFQNAETLEEIVQLLVSKIEESWQRNSKLVKITRHSKLSGTTNVNYLWTNIDYLEVLKTGTASKTLSRKQSNFSLMTKLKKSQTKSVAHRNL